MRKIKIFSCNFAERKIITKKNNNMKTVLNIVLAAIAVFLLYICYESVMGPVRFEEEKNFRDKVVQARLLDIRKAQAEYSNTHDRQYTDNFDSLIYFVKNQKLPLVFKKGVLSDAQLENGLTDVRCKLYPGYRHELLNELDHEVVDRDILEWMESKSN